MPSKTCPRRRWGQTAGDCDRERCLKSVEFRPFSPQFRTNIPLCNLSQGRYNQSAGRGGPGESRAVHTARGSSRRSAVEASCQPSRSTAVPLYLCERTGIAFLLAPDLTAPVSSSIRRPPPFKCARFSLYWPGPLTARVQVGPEMVSPSAGKPTSRASPPDPAPLGCRCAASGNARSRRAR